MRSREVRVTIIMVCTFIFFYEIVHVQRMHEILSRSGLQGCTCYRYWFDRNARTIVSPSRGEFYSHLTLVGVKIFQPCLGRWRWNFCSHFKSVVSTAVLFVLIRLWLLMAQVRRMLTESDSFHIVHFNISRVFFTMQCFYTIAELFYPPSLFSRGSWYVAIYFCRSFNER